MATLTVETTSRSGLDITMNAAAAGGDDFANAGVEMMLFENSTGAGITVTIVSSRTVDAELSLAVADPTIVVPANSLTIGGPWPTGDYNDGTGKVQMTYSTEVGLTVGIFKPRTN